jgi:DNA-binding HxlR family transcriptional regulator
MSRGKLTDPTNPYHYALHCIGGKWKMTLLHEMFTFGKIHFNQTLKVLPISEKVLSQQLKELTEDGLVQRIVNGDTYPPTITYVLTTEGRGSCRHWIFCTSGASVRWTPRTFPSMRTPLWYTKRRSMWMHSRTLWRPTSFGPIPVSEAKRGLETMMRNAGLPSFYVLVLHKKCAGIAAY